MVWRNEAAKKFKIEIAIERSARYLRYLPTGASGAMEAINDWYLTGQRLSLSAQIR